jgi:hypothetical protein
VQLRAGTLLALLVVAMKPNVVDAPAPRLPFQVSLETFWCYRPAVP